MAYRVIQICPSAVGGESINGCQTRIGFPFPKKEGEVKAQSRYYFFEVINKKYCLKLAFTTFTLADSDHEGEGHA